MKLARSERKSFFREHRAAALILLLLLAERLWALRALGVSYTLWSDDLSYVNSGIYWMQTGTITMHDAYPSAQIMPGMPVLIGLFAFLFGSGKALWAALKLVWILMGTLTAWFLYRTVRLFAPAWCALASMLLLARPDFVWMDNLVLTETPFMLALTAMVYFTLRLGKEPGWRSFWGCLTAYLAALLLKASIAPYPLFALLYLLLVRYDRKFLLKQCGAAAGIILCLLLPWSVRNYARFHALIPLTYGAGNPALLGTYQGTGFPADEELDYETYVDGALERDPFYYQADGTPKPQYVRYLSLLRDGAVARYRQRVWLERSPGTFFYSYLAVKPAIMIGGVFYWEPLFGVDSAAVEILQRLDLLACLAALAACLGRKTHRRPALFLTGLYLANVLIYAASFAFGRYNAPLMCLRFALIGLGLDAAAFGNKKR